MAAGAGGRGTNRLGGRLPRAAEEFPINKQPGSAGHCTGGGNAGRGPVDANQTPERQVQAANGEQASISGFGAVGGVGLAGALVLRKGCSAPEAVEMAPSA